MESNNLEYRLLCTGPASGSTQQRWNGARPMPDLPDLSEVHLGSTDMFELIGRVHQALVIWLAELFPVAPSERTFTLRLNFDTLILQIVQHQCALAEVDLLAPSVTVFDRTPR